MVPKVPAANAGDLHHGSRGVTGVEVQDQSAPRLIAQSAGVLASGVKIYMEAVGPEDTGFPPFPTSMGKFRAATERYSDDAFVVGAAEEFVVRQLRRQDKVAARYRVHHVREKEEYLCIHWDAQGKVSSRVLRDRHYGKVARRTMRQGLRVPGCQVYQGASGMQARRAV